MVRSAKAYSIHSVKFLKYNPYTVPVCLTTKAINNLIQWSLNCDQRILRALRTHFLGNQVGKCNFDDFEVIHPVV